MWNIQHKVHSNRSDYSGLSDENHTWTLRLRQRWQLGLLAVGSCCAVISMKRRSTQVHDVSSDLVDLFDSLSRCCSSDGTCILGQPDTMCCAVGSAALCSVADVCFQSSEGQPLCCSPGTFACKDGCVTDMKRRMFMALGGECNPVAPQGFRFSNTSMDSLVSVDAPWHPYVNGYNFDGSKVASIDNKAIDMKARSFTISFTITPKIDGSVMLPGETEACVFSKQKEAIGLSVCFHKVNGSTELVCSYTNGEQVVTNTLRQPEQFSDFFVNLPISFTFIDNSTHSIGLVDGRWMQQNLHDENETGISWATNAPLTLGGDVAEGPVAINHALNAFLSNLRWADFAEFPDA